MERIEEGFDVFLHDGEKAIGAVRGVGAKQVIVYIENAGEFAIPLSCIRDVHDEKVVLDPAKIHDDLRNAIHNAHNREDPTI